MKIRYSTKQLVLMAMFTAISIVLVWLIHFPLFPGAAFLLYDPGDITIIITALLFGPWNALGVTVIVALIQGLLISPADGLVGASMHILATGALVAVIGLIVHARRSSYHPRRTVPALVAGVLVMTVTMIGWNMLITPWYYHMPFDVVMTSFMPFIIPFNLIKGGANAVLAFALFYAARRVVRDPELFRA